MCKLIVALCSLSMLLQCSQKADPQPQPLPVIPPHELTAPLVLSDNLLQFTVVKSGARVFATQRMSLEPREGLGAHDWKIQLMTPINAADDSRLECIFDPPSLGKLVIEQPSIPLNPDNPQRSKLKSASVVLKGSQARDFGVTLQVVSSYNFAKVKQRVSLVAVPVNYDYRPQPGSSGSSARN